MSNFFLNMLLLKVRSLGSKIKPSKKPADVGGWLAYCSILKMEAICSSETSSSFRPTWSYNSEERTLHSHRRDLFPVSSEGTKVLLL
jgi:hypothetical protein